MAPGGLAVTGFTASDLTLRLGAPLRWKTRSVLVMQQDEAFNGSQPPESVSVGRESPIVDSTWSRRISGTVAQLLL